MKTLLRIFLVFVVLFIFAAGVGYFVVTRPAFQQKLVESRLPAGSSIKFVQITTGSIELTDLKLQLPDGTSAKLDSLRSDFSPWAALFDHTITMRGLTVDGLVVKLPEASAAPGVTSSSNVPGADSQSKPTNATDATSGEMAKPAGGASGASSSPTDALYALGNLAWLLDLDSVNLNGALIDASRNRYTFDVQTDQIAPGADSTITLAFKLESKEALQGGLKNFSSDARLHFTQKASGGFERLSLESQTSGTDASGGTLLAISQKLALSVNGFEESAELDLSFSADLPHPEVFAPQLMSLQGLSLQGELNGSAEGSALILKSADLAAASNGAQVASIKLKQSLTLGAQQKFAGELMDVSLVNLPLAWLNPWLTNGMQLSGAPLSAQIALSGESSGALQVKTLAPLEISSFSLSLSQDQRPLLQEVIVRMNPVIRVEADQTIRFDLGDFELLDRYGPMISGTLSGSQIPTSHSRASSPTSSALPLTGLQVKANLEIGLAELLKQPALVGMASIMAGQAKVVLDIDGAVEYPAQIQVAITGLRARDLPGTRQDYRLTAQLKETGSSYAFGAKLDAGSETRPSTSLDLAGQVNPDVLPIPFKVNLTASRILQSDLDLLMAAFKADASAPTSEVTSPTPTTSRAPVSRAPQDVQTQVVQRPPWADLNGEATVKVETLTLQSGQKLTGLNAAAKVTEALLSVSDIKAVFEEGRLAGRGQVSFDPGLSKAYTLTSALTFENVDPFIFSKAASGSFPVRGLFAGSFNQNGRGATLEEAIDDSEGDLTITGRDGVLTAFELDNRSQLGLIGASILGQSLERPGITALAQAVPYFKDMHFDNFTLKLVRTQDKIVRIPELTFMGDNLRINGQGSIAASSLREVLSQPLDLTLGLGAKGRLVDYLETLQLLGSKTGEDGFRNWNKDIQIGGTLGDPNTSALKEMLNNAARRAIATSQSQNSARQTPVTETAPATDNGRLQPGQTPAEATPPAEPKKKTKEERRRDEIDMGVDLLNSILGG